MSFSQLYECIRCDLYRYHGRTGFFVFLKSILFVKGFKFVFWLRLTNFFSGSLVKYFPMVFHYYYKRSYSSDIGYKHEIGKGFSLYHVFGTAFSSGVVIGDNVTITQGVTLGHKNGQSPKLKNNIYIGPGACVLGNVVIGNNVVIGANAVVTKDIPDGSIVVGNPFKIVGFSEVNNVLINTVNENACH